MKSRAAFLFIAVRFSMNGQSWKSDETIRQEKAVAACKQSVLTRLKTPSVAKFSPPSETRISGTGPYTVTGYVDSQNSFGATLRLDFTCEMSPDGVLVDLKLRQR